MHGRTSAEYREQSAKRRGGRHLTLRGPSKRGIFDMHLLKETFRPFRRLKRFENDRLAIFTNRKGFAGNAELGRQFDCLLALQVDDLSGCHVGIPETEVNLFEPIRKTVGRRRAYSTMPVFG